MSVPSGSTNGRRKARRGSAKSFTDTAANHDLHFKEYRPPGREKPERSLVTYDYDVAMLRRRMMTVTLKNELMDVTAMNPKELADNIEMLAPLLRPNGCGPVAPADSFVLRTYDKILEVRNETRFDERGMTVGDRTFKRCYQQALRDIARYNDAPEVLQKEATAKGAEGIPVDFELRDERSGGRTMTHVIPRRAADPKSPHGRLRCPEHAIQHAFAYVMDKYWHRYLFPFGCYFLKKPADTGRKCWQEWVSTMAKDKNNPTLLINPYSVTNADVLYLCNTVGYLDRFIYILGIILWAKDKGCNLLRFERRRGCSHDYRTYMSLERHLHVFGSIRMHRQVLEMNKMDVGGNWFESLNMLEDMETRLGQEFGVEKIAVAKDFDNMMVSKIKGSTSSIVSIFPQAKNLGRQK